MTNYDKLFQEQMKDPEFVKAYYEARLERISNEVLENLKNDVLKDEAKEVIVKDINFIQEKLRKIV